MGAYPRDPAARSVGGRALALRCAEPEYVSRSDGRPPAARLAIERRRVADRVCVLTREFDAIVAASAEANLDDEHDPEGATVGFERAQVLALLEQAARAPRGSRRRPRGRRARGRPVRRVRGADRARTARRPPGDDPVRQVRRSRVVARTARATQVIRGSAASACGKYTRAAPSSRGTGFPRHQIAASYVPLHARLGHDRDVPVVEREQGGSARDRRAARRSPPARRRRGALRGTRSSPRPTGSPRDARASSSIEIGPRARCRAWGERAHDAASRSAISVSSRGRAAGRTNPMSAAPSTSISWICSECASRTTMRHSTPCSASRTIGTARWANVVCTAIRRRGTPLVLRTASSASPARATHRCATASRRSPARRQFHPPRVACEERLAECASQLPDALADGRLRRVQRRRGPAEAPCSAAARNTWRSTRSRAIGTAYGIERVAHFSYVIGSGEWIA